MSTVAQISTENYKGITSDEFKNKFNNYFISDKVFFFLIDYEKTFFDIVSLFHNQEGRFVSDVGNLKISFSTPNWISSHRVSHPKKIPEKFIFEKYPLPYLEYAEQFERVMDEIHKGNTYLLNLTTETPIYTNLNLEQIYVLSQSPYRLNYQNRLLSFSPETFIKINNGVISAFPMKGTYTSLKNAEKAHRQMNLKELAEQTTVVDRVRNDLSQICNRVRVDKFLTIQKVHTHQGKIYQTISEVVGELSSDFFHNPAEALLKLLPAASITGAPRDSTVSIIRKVESHHRHFYTGIWGVCHQGNLDSSVIIRYIEQRGNNLFYKSGGGITFMSETENEYQEMVDKIYLPFQCRN